jgi:hypothetical protein
LRAIQEEPADLSGEAALEFILANILQLGAQAVLRLALKEAGITSVDDLLFFSDEEFGKMSYVPVWSGDQGNIDDTAEAPPSKRTDGHLLLTYIEWRPLAMVCKWFDEQKDPDAGTWFQLSRGGFLQWVRLQRQSANSIVAGPTQVIPNPNLVDPTNRP